MLAFFTKREGEVVPTKTYSRFFSEHCEHEILANVFDQDCAEQVHQLFLVKFVASLSHQTKHEDRTPTQELAGLGQWAWTWST